MGMSAAKGASGGRRCGRRRGAARGGPISEINVTPMVDVMLVLLIVFMVAAPLLTVGVPIDLPQTAAQTMPLDEKPVMISISSAGDVYVDKEVVVQELLISTVDTLTSNEKEARIYVRGDTAAQYGVVMKVMGALSGAGYGRIGLITTQERPE